MNNTTTVGNTTTTYRWAGDRLMITHCEPFEMILGYAPLFKKTFSHYPIVIVLLPILMVTFFTMALQFLLRPVFGDADFVAQMLAGIAIGPSLLSRTEYFKSIILHPKVITAINVIECMGFIFMLYSLTARIDKGLVKKSGKLGIVIGIGSFFVPLLVTAGVSLIVKKVWSIDGELAATLPTVAALEATTSFHVVLAKLTELKLLNSEIGRLALTSSFISGLFSWVAPSAFSYSAVGSRHAVRSRSAALTNASIIVTILVVVFAVRPIILWMMRRTPEGQPLRQGYVVTMNVLVLISAFTGEVTGQTGYLGPFILGISTPVAPPMGPLLVDKIQFFVWTVFMPCFVINTGRRVDLLAIKMKHFWALELIIFTAGVVKTFAIVIPCLYSKIPMADSFALALFLNCRGVYDILTFTRAKQRLQITDESFSIMVITAIFQAAIFNPLMKLVHDSSRKYVAYANRTIQHSEQHVELRILVGIHEIDHISTIINLLDASNPQESNISIYVMYLEEYVGRSMPMVIAHRLDKPPASKHNRINPIIKAFSRFQQKNMEFTSVQCFTAIAPFASMHDDICTMAFQKGTSLVIFPFNKMTPLLFTKVIKNVLNMAPCSIGIIYDRGLFMDLRTIFSRKPTINVCVLFLGGPDDREALAFGARMGRNQGVILTVVRLIAENPYTLNDFVEEDLDSKMINDYRDGTLDRKNWKYSEQSVEEGADTARFVNSIGDYFDLFVVGRRHDERDTPALLGLMEWSEIEELGVVGDLLASSDCKSEASVLVIQQQAYKIEGW